MNTDYIEIIKKIRAEIAFLEKLKKEVDPASCMSVAVRRGVPSDNPDIEDNVERRPWMVMQYGTNCSMNNLLDLLISDRTQSLVYFTRRAQEYVKELEAVINGKR